ncbi:hypothetical protein BOTBODRAFT_28660 [Botryobasidium botryosum FD-172 SS1]|uniref:Uncharacterized protein n=1 Tax=Botryobasidium botryosum (strain FD-172 SS1) TaxID=930990 RepID=A0A067MU79_BOTB1|nr:hypothetical protein BOTBODRAFT_28660 [Botryobasidium botryosum FD-172 SS1]
MSTVSLPEHLHATLLALIEPSPLLPLEISSAVSLHVKKPIEESSAEIPYDTLRNVSNWAQTEDAIALLRERGLNPSEYLMISLLAGTIYAPSSRPPPVISIPDPEEQQRRDRKAISALINALFSILGVGVAAWYAAGASGWRDEWKVLFSIFASIVVALAEGGLYLIWTGRPAKQKHSKGGLSKKREDTPPAEIDADAVAKEGDKNDGTIRKRATAQHASEEISM